MHYSDFYRPPPFQHFDADGCNEAKESSPKYEIERSHIRLKNQLKM